MNSQQGIQEGVRFLLTVSAGQHFGRAAIKSTRQTMFWLYSSQRSASFSISQSGNPVSRVTVFPNHQCYHRLRILNAKMDHQRELLQSIVERMEINMDQDLIDDPATAQRRISRYAVVKQHKPRQLWKQLQNVQKLKSALRKSSVVERKISAIIEGGPAEEEDQVQADVFNT